MTSTIPTPAAAGKIDGTSAVPEGRSERWSSLLVSLFLAALVWFVFGQSIHFEFVNFDDNDYVYANPMVAQGLTRHGVVWAFTQFHSFNWHPLTWISHMVDCECYGLDAGGHHFTNVLLHAAAAILLFLVLRNATGFLWRSAFVAAIFGAHPLRAESVAWVAERKDVLSGVFFMLTMAAYVYYARRTWSPSRYALVVICFALGLLCKPMLVTLPVVLLLLDYWPMRRITADAAEPKFAFATFRVPKRLILEKLPLLGLSLASTLLTFAAQSQARASFAHLPFSTRLLNAAMSCVKYLEQLFWPVELAAVYPYPAHPPRIWEDALAVLLLGLISLAVFALRKTRPYLLMGWLWYLVMLTPVIGIFQVGMQARADRYTYLPQIGVCILLTWLAADEFGRRRTGRCTLAFFSAAAVAALVFCAREQTGYWRNSETLWRHALACTSNNSTAEENLGAALLQKLELTEAVVHFQNAITISPQYADAHAGLALALSKEGDFDGAIPEFQKALELDSKKAAYHDNFGTALLQQNKLPEAAAQYEAAIQNTPNDFAAHNNLGNVLWRQGNTNAAIVHYEKALELARATRQSEMVQQISATLNALRNETPTR